MKDLLFGYQSFKIYFVVIKFMKVIVLVFFGGVFEIFGVEFQVVDIWQMIIEFMIKIFGYIDFIVVVCDFLYFVGECIVVFCVIGLWRFLLYIFIFYQKWVDDVYDVLDKFVGLFNLEVLGFDYYIYVVFFEEFICVGGEIKQFVRVVDVCDGIFYVLFCL